MSRLFEYFVYRSFFSAFIVMAATLFFLVVSFVFWMSAHNNKNYYGDRVADIELEISGLQSRISIAKTLQRNRVALSGVVDRINHEISQATLINELNKMVSVSGITLAEQAFQEVSYQSGVNVYKQSLKVFGVYTKIRNFLVLLSDSISGLNVVRKISIRQENDGAISANIELETYSVNTK